VFVRGVFDEDSVVVCLAAGWELVIVRKQFVKKFALEGRAEECITTRSYSQ
jgi:hypothetical protein